MIYTPRTQKTNQKESEKLVMQIVLGKNLGLTGFRRPFTQARERFDLGKGAITVSGNNAAGYSTFIPISDANYRHQNPTKARAEYCLDGDWHRFVIWDDYGTRYEVDISNDDEGRALAEKQVASMKTARLLGKD